ncbi:MAG: hypothetical protein A2784_02230 [Candidatus Chisholmbacteria bacterium RIFCSPHIGHO2_01_FULL_48_12]|uniref:HAD family hydrolase n=1 Tax=Candidatus Chisholmbacteria bacterium RIFCSPHIGHO2_01_FULL_48_12 TaxID=1797589 RepID=A0A1G1VLP4_9BACT|nr:MAG: hypothetical protein A2784_02230 [Candidatus Chisholmbacteria bacterium RIFCSPHIGHO2_01_FULL_48_12]
MPQNQLVIFDFDGVIVDTEYTTFKFYQKILPKWGIYLKESDFKYKIARKSIDFFRDVLPPSKFDETFVKKIITLKRQAFLKNIKKYLKIIPYSLELIDACKKKSIHLAIGSQNERELLEKVVDVFDIRHYFELIISLQDLKNKKPNPEIFLLISQKLNVPPSQAVVIEDGREGIQAAKAGGFKAIGYTNSFTKEELVQDHPDLIIESLKQLTPQILRSI